MRRGPVVGNLFSITSSYLLMKSLTKFLNKQLPNNNKFPWWRKEVTTTEITVSSSLQNSLLDSDATPVSSLLINKDVENMVLHRNINVDNKSLRFDDIESQHFISIFETWNKWMDKRFNTFLLYSVIVFCLLYLPLHDLYEYRRMKRKRNELCDKNRNGDLKITDLLNNNLISSNTQNASISKEIESSDSSVIKNGIKDVAVEFENKLDTIEGEIEHKNPENFQHDKEDVTLTKNLSNYTAASSLVSSPELLCSPKHDYASLNSPYKSDQSNQTSQSSTVFSASSVIQFSPSRSAHLNAQVDTRNAYSQPFKFK